MQEPRVTSTRVVYENRWIRLHEDQLERPDGSPGLYAWVEKPPAAVIVPLEVDHVWLVEQHRHAVGARFWEFPQGAWEEDPGAAPEDLARGELAEETGLRAGRLRHLGHLDLAPGLSTQEFDVWLATDLTPGPVAREATEADMTTAFVPETEFRRMVRDGRYTDAPSLAAYSLLLLQAS